MLARRTSLTMLIVVPNHGRTSGEMISERPRLSRCRVASKTTVFMREILGPQSTSRLGCVRLRQSNPHVVDGKVLVEMLAPRGTDATEAMPVGNETFQDRERERMEIRISTMHSGM